MNRNCKAFVNLAAGVVNKKGPPSLTHAAQGLTNFDDENEEEQQQGEGGDTEAKINVPSNYCANRLLG